MLNEKPLFSVIIPTYNSEKTLESCLNSLVNQGCPGINYEVIVADDASTDQSIALAKHFQSKLQNLNIHSHPINAGPGMARNIGLNHARGEWILFLDSDDELSPDALENLYSFIQAQSNDKLEAIGFDWTEANESAHLNSSARVGRRDGQFLNNKETLLSSYLSHRMDGSVIYTAIRRRLIDRHALRFAAGLHEDVDFLFRIYLLSTKTLYFDKVLYHKRNQENSIINTISLAHIEGYFRAWSSIGELLNEPDTKLDNRDQLIDQYSYGTMGTIATRVREVVRHCNHAQQQTELFQAIYQLSHPLIKRFKVWDQLEKATTVYGAITRYFLKTMSSDSESLHEKSTNIVTELKEMTGKSWSCTDLHHSLFLRPDQVRTCCKRFFVDEEMRGDVVLFETPADNPNIPLEIGTILDSKRELHQKINAGLPSPCDGCPFLEFRNWSPLNQLEIHYLSLEYHSICNLECSYCSDEYYGGKKANYNLTQTIENFLNEAVLDHCGLVVWGGGEPVVGDNFSYLAELLAKHLPNIQQRFLTNAVKKSTLVKDLLANKKGQIITSIDAGSDEVFLQVRGRNKLHQVCKNLKFYGEHNPERVTIKYIFTEGNGSDIDIDQFVKLMIHYKLLDCTFQISGDFKQESITTDTGVRMMMMFGLLHQAGNKTAYFDELLWHRLIELDISSMIKKAHARSGFEFIALPAHYPQVVVWGAGQQARYLLEKSHFFKSVEVAYFVDATPSKQGSEFYGKRILPPAALLEDDLPVVIAAVQGVPLILEQFHALGCSNQRLIRELII